MNEKKKNVDSNWILCRSKSFPGKFYYFNVINGETVWTQNQADNKGLKSHLGAEKSYSDHTASLPDEPTKISNDNSTNTMKSDAQNTSSIVKLPILDQANSIIPKQLIPILWASLPIQMFGTDTKKPDEKMVDKGTQKPEFKQTVEKEFNLAKLDNRDLRFLLLAKRNSSDSDTAVDRKKARTNKTKAPESKKKVTFDLKDDSHDDHSTIETQDLIPISPNVTATNIEVRKSPLVAKNNFVPSFIKESTKTPPPIAMNQLPICNNTTWYIVADMDVLLLDYEYIEQLVLSDPKCQLLVPQGVISDIEALCAGNCRGRKRVIKARQLSRKLALPPPYCTVEPQTLQNSTNVTTDNILRCCSKAVNKNFYVVLIANDHYLLKRAKLLKIPSYKLSEIKLGVDINPYNTPKRKHTKPNNPSDYVTSMFDQNTRNVYKITTETKFDENNVTFNDNNVRNPKKQEFLCSDGETDAYNKLVKKQKFDENISISNSDVSDVCTSDMSSFGSSQQLRGKNDLRPQNVDRNPFSHQNDDRNSFLTQNIKETGLRLSKNREINHVNNDYNYGNKKNQILCYHPIINMKTNESKLDNSVTSNTELSSRQESCGISKQNNMLNPSLITIIKPIKNIIPKNQVESTSVLKVPKQLALRNATKNTSVRVENSPLNDKIGTRLNKATIDERVKKFQIKNNTMKAKIITRMDEWICFYMQIMEDVLINILQETTVCTQNTTAPLTLKDTINCIKMLFDANTNIREAINNLLELLDKYMIGVHGQFKMPIAPEDFMKLFGFGVLLVNALRDIFPLNENLQETKSRLNAFYINLQSNTKDEDPELVKTPSVYRVDNNDEENLPQYFKKTSYVIEYLKKHYKEWKNYKGMDENDNKIENHTDYKVVRTVGKNLNLLKIDKRNNMSLSNITKDDNYRNGIIETKLVRMIKNDQLTKPNNTENVVTHQTNIINENNRNNTDYWSNVDINYQHKEVLTNSAKTVTQDRNFESKDDAFNNKIHENIFLDNTQKYEFEPKIVRTFKTVDEFEDKINTREPLDMDLLDYTEMSETAVDNFTDFKENEKTENSKNFDLQPRYKLDTPMYLEDFYITPTNSAESVKNLENTADSKCSENKNTMKDKNTSASAKNDNATNFNIEDEAEKINTKTETNTENGIRVNKYETPNSGTHLDNSEESHGVNFGNTSDSGFDNDNTNAHAMVKVLYYELSTTFLAIHAFVTKFVEEIRTTTLLETRKNTFRNIASNALEHIEAIINKLKSIIEREKPDVTVLKTLLRNAGIEANTDKRVTRYRQIVIKCLEQAQILENALKIIVSTTKGDFDFLSTNRENINTNIRYFNIFESVDIGNI